MHSCVETLNPFAVHSHLAKADCIFTHKSADSKESETKRGRGQIQLTAYHITIRGETHFCVLFACSQGAVSVTLIRRFVTKAGQTVALTDACLAPHSQECDDEAGCVSRRVTRSEGVAVLIARGALVHLRRPAG
jgi:hypothetical protein